MRREGGTGASPPAGPSPGFVPSRHLTATSACTHATPLQAGGPPAQPAFHAGAGRLKHRRAWTLPPWDVGFEAGGDRLRGTISRLRRAPLPREREAPVLPPPPPPPAPAPAPLLPPVGPLQSRGCRGRVRPSRERGAGGRAGREDGGGEGASAAGGGAARRLRGAGGRRGPLYQHRVHPGGESPPVHRGARTPRPRRRPPGPPLPARPPVPRSWPGPRP